MPDGEVDGKGETQMTANCASTTPATSQTTTTESGKCETTDVRKRKNKREEIPYQYRQCYCTMKEQDRKSH